MSAIPHVYGTSNSENIDGLVKIKNLGIFWPGVVDVPPLISENLGVLSACEVWETYIDYGDIDGLRPDA